MSNKAKVLLAAATDWRSLGVVVASTAATVILQNPFIPLLGAGIFIAVVNNVLQSPAFQTGLRLQQVVEETRQVVESIRQLANDTRTPSAVRIANEAERLAFEFLKQPELDTTRQVLVGQAMKLAEMFLKITEAQLKMADATRADMHQASQLSIRVAQLEHQLRVEQEPARRREIERALNLDRESLARVQQRLTAQEDLNYKLQSLESAFSAACQRFYSPEINIGDDNIEMTLTEAEALYDALDETNHTRRWLRQ